MNMSSMPFFSSSPMWALFFIHSVTLCLFTGMFSPFTFKVIIGRYVIIAMLLMVFPLPKTSLYFHYPLSLKTLIWVWWLCLLLKSGCIWEETPLSSHSQIFTGPTSLLGPFSTSVSGLVLHLSPGSHFLPCIPLPFLGHLPLTHSLSFLSAYHQCSISPT